MGGRERAEKKRERREERVERREKKEREKSHMDWCLLHTPQLGTKSAIGLRTLTGN